MAHEGTTRIVARWAKEHRAVLAAVWEGHNREGRWPSESTLHRYLLARGDRLDVPGVVRHMPAELGRLDSTTGCIELTPRALQFVDGTTDVLDAFVLVARLALSRFRDPARAAAIEVDEIVQTLGHLSDHRSAVYDLIEADPWLLRFAARTGLPAVEAVSQAVTPALDVSSIRAYLEAHQAHLRRGGARRGLRSRLKRNLIRVGAVIVTALATASQIGGVTLRDVFAPNSSAPVSLARPGTPIIQLASSFNAANHVGAMTTAGGLVWVADDASNSVSAFDTATDAGRFEGIKVGPGADHMVAGFGYIWVWCGDDNSLWRINASTGEASPLSHVFGGLNINGKTLAQATGQGNLAVGADSIWVSKAIENRTGSKGAELFAVDPQSLSIAHHYTFAPAPRDEGLGDTAVIEVGGSILASALGGHGIFALPSDLSEPTMYRFSAQPAAASSMVFTDLRNGGQSATIWVSSGQTLFREHLGLLSGVPLDQRETIKYPIGCMITGLQAIGADLWIVCGEYAQRWNPATGQLRSEPIYPAPGSFLGEFTASATYAWLSTTRNGTLAKYRLVA